MQYVKLRPDLTLAEVVALEKEAKPDQLRPYDVYVAKEVPDGLLLSERHTNHAAYTTFKTNYYYLLIEKINRHTCHVLVYVKLSDDSGAYTSVVSSFHVVTTEWRITYRDIYTNWLADFLESHKSLIKPEPKTITAVEAFNIVKHHFDEYQLQEGTFVWHNAAKVHTLDVCSIRDTTKYTGWQYLEVSFHSGYGRDYIWFWFKDGELYAIHENSKTLDANGNECKLPDGIHIA